MAAEPVGIVMDPTRLPPLLPYANVQLERIYSTDLNGQSLHCRCAGPVHTLTLLEATPTKVVDGESICSSTVTEVVGLFCTRT
mmetsp:Transcript_5117/g.10322  ORF Transcript_5117/g.10322 Transcript_5117/m.10322 type:complete len:83 (-) Transcript_5117:329-577(-)